MNWKHSLDRYLTQEPPDESWWFEKCASLLNCNEHSAEDKWMNYLFNKGCSPEHAAELITKLIKQKENENRTT